MESGSKSKTILVRRAVEEDLPAIERIQARSFVAAQWPVRDYLNYDCRVAICVDRTAGYVVARTVAPDESEILNLAVGVEFRRLGVGRALIRDLLRGHPGTVFLEVRESNQAARRFYEAMHFQMVGVRTGYYTSPPESGIVMKLHSC